MVIFIYLVQKYPFCVNLIQKFKRVILRQNLVLPALECLTDNLPPPALIDFPIFFHPEHLFSPLPPLFPPLINYLGKFSTRVWSDILMLTFLLSRKRSDPPACVFFLQVCANKPTQGFVSIKKPTYCQLLTSFRRSNRMFVEVFIECVAWSYWWTWCVSPITCYSPTTSAFLYSVLTYQIKFLCIKFSIFQPPFY